MRLRIAVTFAACLGAQAAASDATRDSLPSALEAGWNGERVCDLLHESTTHRVLKCTFAPGVGHGRHFHPAHFGYALSGGTMRLTDARETRDAVIETGSHYSSAGTAWHEVLNVGESPVIYLIVEEVSLADQAASVSTRSG